MRNNLVMKNSAQFPLTNEYDSKLQDSQLLDRPLADELMVNNGDIFGAMDMETCKTCCHLASVLTGLNTFNVESRNIQLLFLSNLAESNHVILMRKTLTTCKP